MRLYAFMLLMVFSFQTVDVPPLADMRHPKTCCGRVICKCHHAKGMPCDYKRKVSPAPKRVGDAHAGCPFHKGMPRGEMNSLTSKALSVQAKTRSHSAEFTQAPCQSNTPKSLLPNTVRDYEPPVRFEMSAVKSFQILFQKDFRFYLSPGLSSPDHPPRVLFSL